MINEYQKILKNNLLISQILVSPDDTEQRRRAINVRRTFENLFKLGVIPIVNENDTTATSEIKYGDNDRLAARVAQIINADSLIILSDVDGLYDENKKLIKKVTLINQSIYNLADNHLSKYGSRGNANKIRCSKNMHEFWL